VTSTVPALDFAVAAFEPLLAMTVVRHTLERLWPAHLKRDRLQGVGLAAFLALALGQFAATPALGGLTTAAVNAAGGGLIALPARGWGWWAGLAAYFLAMDLGEYLFHRAQHAIPAMWAMHSLHHSDRAFDSATAVRHFWLEPAIKTVTIWLAVGVLFKTPYSIQAVYIVASFYHFVVHSNTRIDYGRWSWVLNAPGYHRIHHSDAPEHFDVNFASLFPIYDVLSGTYRPLRRGERIQTGLDTGEEPLNLADVLSWPVRGRLPRLRPRRRTILPA
jgi:sterol desaturase/sphingolipid hydroxylase (fatty acid hydroxylase superfamily)